MASTLPTETDTSGDKPSCPARLLESGPAFVPEVEHLTQFFPRVNKLRIYISEEFSASESLREDPTWPYSPRCRNSVSHFPSSTRQSNLQLLQNGKFAGKPHGLLRKPAVIWESTTQMKLSPVPRQKVSPRRDTTTSLIRIRNRLCCMVFPKFRPCVRTVAHASRKIPSEVFHRPHNRKHRTGRKINPNATHVLPVDAGRLKKLRNCLHRGPRCQSSGYCRSQSGGSFPQSQSTSSMTRAYMVRPASQAHSLFLRSSEARPTLSPIVNTNGIRHYAIPRIPA